MDKLTLQIQLTAAAKAAGGWNDATFQVPGSTPYPVAGDLVRVASSTTGGPLKVLQREFSFAPGTTELILLLGLPSESLAANHL